ncbi:MAG: GAF domain-containing protein [Mycobacterium sp.]|nr:GAF domain-containing protein [Mycobacterium sp.]
MTASEEMRRSRMLLDRLPGLMGYWDRELHNIIANDAYFEYFGMTPDEIRGRHISEVLGEAVYALNLPYLQAALAGEEQLFERTLVDRHGKTRYTQASYVPDIVDGDVWGLCVQVTDMTARVEAERARDEALRLFHIGMANAPFGEAILDSSGHSDLEATLYRIITAGMELTGARYGAIGIRGKGGGMASFLHAGMDADTVRLIGELPAGKGLLGLLLDEGRTLRVGAISAHQAACGFPEHHPPMRALLGVPITIRRDTFGTLYLTDPQRSRTFTQSDENAARTLASAAAVAVDHAQLFERERAAARFTEASRQITTQLLSGGGPPVRPLQLIVDRARELTNAEQAIVLVPNDDQSSFEDVQTLFVTTAVGLHADEVVGQLVPVEGSTTGSVFRSGAPVITETFRHPIQAFTDVGERPAIVMPLRAEQSVIGVIAVARPKHQEPFDASYLEMVSDFADHAAMALTLAAAREHERELTVFADRERIAQDLHDHVIQRLFAVGMGLHGTIARSSSPDVTERLNRTVDDLQTIVQEIRTTIHQLQPPGERLGDLRTRIQRAVADLTDDSGIATTVHMSGPMTVADACLLDHAEAVTVEAVSNAVRHSGAQHLTVKIDVADELRIDVTDDGCGINPTNTRHSGLANMLRRAELVGGSCEIDQASEGGTHIRWTAPLGLA